ncbi:MAG: glycosyltransferase family 4 protein [Desulfurococcaceae archaeon]
MKVLVIASSVSKTPNGISYSFVFDEICRLARKGIEVHVVRSRVEEDSFTNDIHFYGLRYALGVDEFFSYVIQMINRKIPIGLFRSPRTIYWEGRYYSRVLEIVKDLKVEIIHAHFAYPEGVIGYLAKARTKRPLVVTTHGFDLQTVPEIKYGARLSLRIDQLVRKVINSADAIIVPSKRIYKISKSLTNEPHKVFLIYNGVDTNMFNPNIDKSIIREKLGIKEDELIVLTARRLYPVYGIEYLIRAIPEITKYYKNVRFVIVGDGPLRGHLHKLARKLDVDRFTIFTGSIPRTLMPLYLAATDVVCLPSLMEGLPIFLLEALASGKPVVATKVGGIPEAVINGYNGYLVEPKNPQGLASALLELISSSEKLKVFGQRSRVLAEEKFDIEKRVNSIINIYKSLL